MKLKSKSTFTIALILLLTCSAFFAGFRMAQKANIQKEHVIAAQTMLDLNYDAKEIEMMLPGLNRSLSGVKELHEFEIGNETPPALWFNPLVADKVLNVVQTEIQWDLPTNVSLPDNMNELAFYTVAELSVLIKNKSISSVDLTAYFINRLKTHGDALEAVITLTEDRAMASAKKADELLEEGIYLGPLHGIPYGAKDLLSVPDYKTTWGAAPYKEQNRGQELATVIKKLDEAGAILVAKLTLGALAMGDVWYGGKTKNPWNLEQGSSGSSAGSASTTAAGLVPFALGTETLGSIVSPATRNGVTGLRPTYGRVSKAGAMALSWSMDKIGPIARTAFDCALIFDVIRGEDQIDLAVKNAAFNYSGKADLSKLKVGYLKSHFDRERNQKGTDDKVLEVLRGLGAELIPVEMPGDMPFPAMQSILSAEAAAAFDALTRSNNDDQLVRQSANAWPNSFRRGHFVSAVDYINANRARYILMQKTNAVFEQFDVIVSPSYAGAQLLTTNLTGHPCVVVKNGYNEQGSPTSISFLGNLYDEATILSVARTYQEATEFDEQHPEKFKTK
jgi:Asp-tRNA(Asn)/Glu-tRNA(Gln) amidotransferase A subunit family amidase